MIDKIYCQADIFITLRGLTNPTLIMKSLLKISVCLLFVAAVNYSFAQQATPAQKTPAAKASKKHVQKKNTKAVDNKIAVSDQAQPNDKKSSKTAAKKDKAISNK